MECPSLCRGGYVRTVWGGVIIRGRCSYCNPRPVPRDASEAELVAFAYYQRERERLGIALRPR